MNVNVVGGVAVLEVNLDEANDGVQVFGTTGAAVTGILVDAQGHTQADVLTSALPAGAATEGELDTQTGILTTIDVDTGNTATSVASIDGKITACNTGAVTITVSALPAGAATEATLAALDAKVTAVDTTDKATATNQATANASLASIDGKITACNTGAIAGSVTAQPISAILEGGLTELIGINEQVDLNDYSGSVGVALGGTYSGELLNITLYSTEDGTGAIQDNAGVLFIFDADPSIASGDTSMSAVDGITAIAKINILATDWTVDATVGICTKTVAVGFHAVSTLYFVFKNTDATAFNDNADEDEQLEFNFWYRRDS